MDSSFGGGDVNLNKTHIFARRFAANRRSVSVPDRVVPLNWPIKPRRTERPTAVSGFRSTLSPKMALRRKDRCHGSSNGPRRFRESSCQMRDTKAVTKPVLFYKPAAVCGILSCPKIRPCLNDDGRRRHWSC